MAMTRLRSISPRLLSHPRRFFNDKSRIDRLLRPNELSPSALDLEEIDVDLYVAPQSILWAPAGGVGVFGGQVIGQALHAASLTSQDHDFELHSMHAYFLRPGNVNHPIVYTVKRTRDGRSFLSRTIEATQRGKVIFECAASFHKREECGINHSPTMPNVPPPEELEEFDSERLVKSLLKRSYNTKFEEDFMRKAAILQAIDKPFAIDVRWVGKNLASPSPSEPRSLVWMKTSKTLPNNPHLHRAVAAAFSDFFLIATACKPHGIGFPSPKIEVLASLDHSMWFHSPFRADEWLLVDINSPMLSSSRALSFGNIFTRDGNLAVSCAQEGLLRFRKEEDFVV